MSPKTSLLNNKNRTTATQALYSAAPSSLKPLLRLSPSLGLDQISTDFLKGTPSWFTGLAQDVQTYLVTNYRWTATGSGIASTESSSTTDLRVQITPVIVVPGVVSGVPGPVITSIVSEAGSSIFTTTVTLLTTAHDWQPPSSKSSGVEPAETITPPITNTPPASSTANSATSSTSVESEVRPVEGPQAPNEHIIAIAIGTALGGALIAVVILLVAIRIIKRRRRAQFFNRSAPAVLQHAAKVAPVDESVAGSSNGKSTIRPVEAGSTPRNSWFRYSNLPEVVHEMGGNEEECASLGSNLISLFKPKRRPLSSHF